MLDLNDLGAGQPCLTSQLGGAMAQAEAVCLEHEGHIPGTRLIVRGTIQTSYVLNWAEVTGHARRTWADPREATEKGAEGVAILLIRRETGYVAIERAAIGTHIDRWLGYESDAPYFQRKARLEVSGILRGSDGDVRMRVREKMDRLGLTSHRLPAYVVVVEFSGPLAEAVSDEH